MGHFHTHTHPGASAQAQESQESIQSVCLSSKGVCDPEDERLGRGTSPTRQLRCPQPSSGLSWVLMRQPGQVGHGFLRVLMCQGFSPAHILPSCHQLGESVVLAEPRGTGAPFLPPLQDSLLCSRRVHFKRTQTLPIRGHQVGRRPLRKRQSLPRTLFRYQ